jgi:hypothetical protein
MNTKVNLKVQVPVPITMLSDSEILAELNRRNLLIKWARKALKQPCKPTLSEGKVYGFKQ